MRRSAGGCFTHSVLTLCLGLSACGAALGQNAKARKEFAEAVRQQTSRDTGHNINLTAEGQDSTLYVFHEPGVTSDQCKHILSLSNLENLRKHAFTQLVCIPDQKTTFTFDLAQEENEILAAPICIRSVSGIIPVGGSGKAVLDGTDAQNKSLVEVFQKAGFSGTTVCQKDEMKGTQHLELTYSPVGIVVGGVSTYDASGASSGTIGGVRTIVWNLFLQSYTADGTSDAVNSWVGVCYTCLVPSAKEMAKQLKKAAKQSNKH
jgi:hypothetical protein